MFSALSLVRVLEEHEWESTTGPLFSATQISTNDECERKWAWRRIAKIVVPQAPSAELGSRTHHVLERYLGEDIRPDYVSDREAAEIASSGLHLLPPPKTAGMRLEKEFRFQSLSTGFIYHGFKDVEIAPGVPVPTLDLDGSAPIVIDHKSTSSIDKYAKTASDLLYDVQATLYGLDAMARFDAPNADLAWVYYQTKGTRRSHATVARLEIAHAAKVFLEIERSAKRMAAALEGGKQALDLPPNPNACRAYGGCPYREHCNISAPSVGSSNLIRSRMNSSVIASLRARVQGTAAPAEEKPAVSAPVMGCADTEVPAVTEIPKALLEEPVRINPPEADIPLPTEAPAPAPAEAKTEEKPKRATRKKTEKDPLGADIAMHTKVDEPKAAPAPVPAPAAQTGFTLYVDCIPIGKPAKTAALLISKAQERIANELKVPDYRLVDFGKGTPAFVAFVLDQVDGTFDIALDTRTPEGAVLLEALMAKASFAVRGFR